MSRSPRQHRAPEASPADQVTATMAGPLAKIAERTQAAREVVDQIAVQIAAPKYSGMVLDNFLSVAILNRLSSMTPAERTAALTSSLAANDDRTLSVVLNSPCWLSGSSEAEQTHLRTRFARQRHPSEVARIERLGKAVEAMERASKAATTFAATLYNASMADAAQRAAQATAAAMVRA